MALQPQTTAVPLFGGIDTKMDRKYVAADKLLAAENVQFFGVNRARKRYGQTALGKGVAGENRNIVQGRAIGSFNNELLSYDGTNVYSYAPGQDAWVNRGALTETDVSVTPIIRSSGSVGGIASVCANGVEYYAWEDTRGGVYYCVRDAVSGAMLVPNTVVGAGLSQPQLVAIGNYVYLFYTTGTAIYAAQFLTASPAAGIVARNLLVNNQQAGGVFGVAANSNVIVLLWWATGNIWTTKTYNPDLSILRGPDQHYILPHTAGSMTFNTDGSYVLISLVSVAASEVHFLFLDPVTNSLTDAGIETVSNISRVRGVSYSNNHFRVYADSTSSPTQPRLDIFELTTSAITNIKTIYGRVLASAPAAVGGQPYVVLASPQFNIASGTSQQRAFYLCGDEGEILQRFSADSATTSGTALPLLQLLADGRLFVGLGQQLQLRADASGTVYAPTGLSTVYFTFPDASNFKVVTFGSTALVSCGNVYTYDGSVLVESGFWEFPDGISTVVAAAGALNAGIYTYCVTYEWSDNAGNTHYSAPSYPVSVGSLAAPIAANSQVTLTIPYTTLTRKVGVTVNIYRTATAPGSPDTLDTGLGPWFKIHSEPNLTDGTASFAYTDTEADAAIQGRQFLYAPPDGTGELENFAPPPFAYMIATKTRVFGIPQDDRTAVMYSKPLALGRPAEFSPLQIVRLESAGGLPTALGYIDTQAVIFKTRRIYFLDGDGPNAQGGGNFFPSPRCISSTSGCISQPSVLSVHDGVFFKSETGIQLLDRGLSINGILGLPVQGFNYLTLTGAVSVPAQNQLRWTSSDGTALVYDYTTQRWCTYTGYTAVGYTEWNGTYARLRADGTTFYEDQTTYLDAGRPVRMLVETSWIKPAALAQGYSAVWYAQVLGQYRDSHTLTIEVAYDYTEVATQTEVFTPAGNINTSVFGNSSTFGADAYYGANVLNPSTNYQPRIALQRQTCEAVKFRIYDTDVTGASCDLNEIALQLGVIGGLNRTTASRQV